MTQGKKLSTAEDSCVVLPDGWGRGKNWAYGYHGRPRENVQPPSSLPLSGIDEEQLPTVKTVEEKVRRMVEKCDRFGGTILMHSLAGGTGSGACIYMQSCGRYS